MGAGFLDDIDSWTLAVDVVEGMPDDPDAREHRRGRQYPVYLQRRHDCRRCWPELAATQGFTGSALPDALPSAWDSSGAGGSLPNMRKSGKEIRRSTQ
jgi:hypothetical protein